MKMDVEMNNARQVKLVVGAELRRIAFTGRTYAEFMNEIRQVLGTTPETKLSISYQDEEGDFITVGSDSELMLAFNIMKDKIVKFSVNSSTAKSEPFALPTFPPLPTYAAPPTFAQPMTTTTTTLPSNPFQAFPSPPASAPVDSTSMPFSPAHQVVYYQHMKEHKPWKHHKKEFKEMKYKEKHSDEETIKGKMAARFIGHVTIEDDTPLSPGTSFIKTWRFRNESTYQWPANTCLICVSKESDKLGGPDVVPVTQQAAPGEEVDVSIPLIAPQRTGRFVCYYRLAGGPKGKKFGQRVRVQIQVI